MKKALIVIVSVLVGIVLIAVIASTLGTREVRNVGEEFVQDFSNGDISEAYELLHPSIHEIASIEDIKMMYEGFEDGGIDLSKLSKTSFTGRSVKSDSTTGKTSEISGYSLVENMVGEELTLLVYLKLQKVDEEWLIYDFEIVPEVPIAVINE